MLESHLKWVLNNGPWSFDNHPLVLHRWKRGMTTSSVNFTLLPIQVQMWGLPFDLISEESKGYRQGLGQVVEIDNKAFTFEQACFVRIRVKISIDKPLRRGAFVVNPKGDRICIEFKYERLVGFCFQCGCLGYEARVCSTPRNLTQTEFPYGEWLKAGFKRTKDGSNGSKKSPPRREAP